MISSRELLVWSSNLPKKWRSPITCPVCRENTLGKYDPKGNFWECRPCNIGVRRSNKYAPYIVNMDTGERTYLDRC